MFVDNRCSIYFPPADHLIIEDERRPISTFDHIGRLLHCAPEEVNDNADDRQLIEVMQSGQILKQSTAHSRVRPTLQFNVEDGKDALVENLEDQIDFQFAAVHLHIL